MDVRREIQEALAHAGAEVGVHVDAQEVPLEHTDDFAHGDYASGIALARAKEAGIAPRALAEEIATALNVGHPMSYIAKIEIAGPGFINFYLATAALAEAVEEARQEGMWGSNRNLSGKRIMVEYTDPNPFKEFHIGHLMSNAIGESIARLLEFSGAEVYRANYQGDVGPHVAKTIWAVKNKKVAGVSWGVAYVVGNQAYESDGGAKKEIDEINAKLYDRSDSAINEMYDAGRRASLAHFEELYKILGTKFDHYFFESETAPRGLELVRKNPGVFEGSDGAIVYKGEKDGLHTRVFVTSKGLPTYETKDLGLAQLKSETWPFDISITVTAHEQADYFAVVLAAMRKVLPGIASKIGHVSHGMMRFADGKMSSRTGNVITGESLLSDLKDAALARARESRADDPEDLAQQIAVGAIKYQILRQASGKDIIFDRARALSLDGDSGPYLQYTHARAHQVIAKARAEGINPRGLASRIPESAVHLVRLLHRFPEVAARAAQVREPHLITNFLIEFAAAFNSWYAQVHIVDGTADAPHKVAVADAVRSTLKQGLWLLGIPAPEKM
ncbi:MAG TPA: arginine--tRNA ligase [Candidatus Paceibacterota bacterium]